uniref:Putative ATPase domain containing protein n=1 Tax=viral metagenome TaxID=1070528 RepID=A0A6M3X8S3_9ZZZZ
MKIIQLEAQNVKRLKAIEIRPDGNLVVIGGKNGAGKSSVLDSIAYVLGGKDAIPSQPVRKGEKKATVVCELDNLIVKRTITATGGGTLTVENKEGAVFKSPQAMLDALCGELTFDPLEFSRMSARKQAETLKGLVGLDFSELENERQSLYDERTRINTDGKALKARFEGMQEYPEAPEMEVSVSGLMGELKERESVNHENEKQRLMLRQGIDDLKNQGIELGHLSEQITDLQVRIDELKRLEAAKAKKIGITKTSIEKAKPRIDALQDADEEEIRDQIGNAETVNQQVRSNRIRKDLSEPLKTKRAESETLADQIHKIDDSKTSQLATAKFPVDGLSFSASEVLYNEIPFNQASSAEQLRVSVAMGIAMNPKLKVLLIRDGSLLDEDNLKMMADMAQEADAQIWLERVGKGQEVSVIIEDGEVQDGKSAMA